jgi:hypothetical protein
VQNLSDDQISDMAENGGIAAIHFATGERVRSKELEAGEVSSIW